MRRDRVLVAMWAAAVAGLIIIALWLPGEAEPAPPRVAHQVVDLAPALRARLVFERRAHAVEVRRLRRVVANDGDVQSAITLASVVYGVPERELRGIAWCESRFTPTARNPSGASGLMQFMPGTWAATPMGRAGLSVWDPYANILAAAWLRREDGSWRQWSCAGSAS